MRWHCPVMLRMQMLLMRLFDAFVGRFRRLDALFNNAGITLTGKPIDEVDVGDWRSLIDINLTGSFICARKAFGLMRHQDPQGRPHNQ